jgi:hypothetical protein
MKHIFWDTVCSFKYSGAKLWNGLPIDAKLAELIYSFNNLLKENDHKYTVI